MYIYYSHFVKLYYYSRLKCKRIYDDFFLLENVLTDAEHVEPALAYVGALVSIGVVMKMTIKKRIGKRINMNVSSKINKIYPFAINTYKQVNK